MMAEALCSIIRRRRFCGSILLKHCLCDSIIWRHCHFGGVVCAVQSFECVVCLEALSVQFDHLRGRHLGFGQLEALSVRFNQGWRVHNVAQEERLEEHVSGN
jgi:hypothetical protein